MEQFFDIKYFNLSGGNETQSSICTTYELGSGYVVKGSNYHASCRPVLDKYFGHILRTGCFVLADVWQDMTHLVWQIWVKWNDEGNEFKKEAEFILTPDKCPNGNGNCYPVEALMDYIPRVVEGIADGNIVRADFIIRCVLKIDSSIPAINRLGGWNLFFSWCKNGHNYHRRKPVRVPAETVTSQGAGYNLANWLNYLMRNVFSDNRFYTHWKNISDAKAKYGCCWLASSPNLYGYPGTNCFVHGTPLPNNGESRYILNNSDRCEKCRHEDYYVSKPRIFCAFELENNISLSETRGTCYPLYKSMFRHKDLIKWGSLVVAYEVTKGSYKAVYIKPFGIDSIKIYYSYDPEGLEVYALFTSGIGKNRNIIRKITSAMTYSCSDRRYDNTLMSFNLYKVLAKTGTFKYLNHQDGLKSLSIRFLIAKNGKFSPIPSVGIKFIEKRRSLTMPLIVDF